MADNAVVWAGMDVGTNSVKILVARVTRGSAPRVEVLRHDVRVTRMGEGLNASGRLAEPPMERALEAIRALAAEARQFCPAGVSALGMEAFRRAVNGPEFARRIEAETGVPVRILKGEEEARLGREGVLSGFGEPLPARVLVLDVGGGSSEMALTSPEWEVSVPRGAVTTTEAYLHGDPPSAAEMGRVREEVFAAMRTAWQASPLTGEPPLVVAVGGTVTSYGSIQLALDEWDPERIHRLRMSAAEVRALTDRLAAMPLDARRRVTGLNPARAPVIVGGGVLLEGALAAVGAEELRISLANLLHAHVLREAERWNTDPEPQHA